MQTLWQTLKAEHKQELEAETLEYPNSTQNLLTELKENVSIFGLSYHAVYTLILHTSLTEYNPIALIHAFETPILNSKEESNEETAESSR